MNIRRYLLLAILFAATASRGQTNFQWAVLSSGDASGSWSLAGNWNPAGPATGQNNTATFNQAITVNSTLTLDGSRTIGNLFFNTLSPGTANWTLSAGAPSSSTLTLTTGSGSPDCNVGNQSATITAVLAGSQGLIKDGAGKLTLSAADTFTGLTVVNAGVLGLNNLNALAAGNTLRIANGAAVQPNLGGTYANVATTINGSSTAGGSFGGSLDFHSSGNTTVTWPGQIVLNSATATVGSYGVNYTVTLAGQLTGSGNLNIRPEGGSASSHTATYVLSNPNNNYAGSTTMQVGTAQASGTLKLGVNNGLPSTTSLDLNRAGNSGVVYFDLAGYNQTLSGLTADFGSNAVINSGASASTLTLANNSDVTFGGVIGASGKSNVSLVKQGSAALTLSGTNLYTGSTTIGAGTLALNGVVTSTSGLLLSSNATLQFALGALGSSTNVIVNGDVTLAGQINVADFGIAPNTAYPAIYYTGNLTNAGVSAAPNAPWAFTIDTSVPHLVRLLLSQQLPLAQFTNTNTSVCTTSTNLGGFLRGTPALPLWYEVRDQTNRLWDYGSTAATSPWSITVRHLRAGTNTVTIFAKDTGGEIQSNSVSLVLSLGADPPVRPRPQPAEIWWGGSCHDNLYDSNNHIVGTYSRMSQLTQTNGWDFVKRYADGLFLHGYVWVNQAARMTNWQQVGASISAQLAPFNGKYWLEDSWYPQTNNMNFGHSSASGQATHADTLLSVGLPLSEITEDFNAQWDDFSTWHPDWPTNNIRVLITGNTNQATAAYPYSSGLWRDYANDFHAARPNIRFGWTWSPVWWHWRTGASLGTDCGIFSVTNNGTTYRFNWDFYDFMNDAVVLGNQAGVPFAFASDCPWDYYGLYPGNPGSWSQAQQLANRTKIRNYEAWLQNQALRHTLICNYSQVNPADTNASDLTYESNSLNTMYLHQQEGGRAWRYSFESWYQGPYTVVPETKAGSYTHLALSAIKYLKGIADTNGTLEPLSLTLLTTGSVCTVRLQNNGDVACLPAVVAFESGNAGTTVQYSNAAGANITAQILSAEGYAHTNMLQPGQSTTLTIAVQGTAPAQSKTVTLEAFWNPQDPTGIVRDRLNVAVPVLFGATNTYVWTNSASGSWSTLLNWSNSLAPVVNGSENCTVRFLGSGGYNASNNLAGQFTLNVLEANSASNNTVNGNPLAFAASAPAGVSPQLNQNGAGAFTLANALTLNSDLTLGGTGGGSVTISGAMGGSGGLVKNGNQTAILLGSNTYAGPTRINSGTLQIGNGLVNGVLPGDTTNNATLKFLVATNTTATYDGTVSGTGAFIADGFGGTLTLSGTNLFTGNVTVNAGALWINNSSALGTGSKTVYLSNGTAGHPELHLDGSGGSISLPAGLSLVTSWVGCCLFNESGNNAVSGKITLTGGGGDTYILANGGTLTLGGVIAPNTTGRNLRLGGAAAGIVTGSITDGTAPNTLPSLRKVDAGTWTLAGSNNFAGPTTVEGGTLLVNGWLGTNSVTVYTNALLGGNGTILGPVTVQPGGSIAPGIGGISTLTINSNLVLQAGCTNVFEISKAPWTNDLVRSLSTVTFGGTLIVSNLAGTLGPNDSFKLFDAASYAGAFSAMMLPPLSPGLVWSNSLALNGSLLVMKATAPPLSFSLSGGTNLTLNWTNGAGSFALQWQTNSLNVGLGTNWLDYPGGSSPPITVPMDRSVGSAMFRLMAR